MSKGYNVKFKNTKQITKILSDFTDTSYKYLKKNPDIYSHTLLIVGLINRTYELTESAVWAIDQNRPLTASNMLRSLFETLGFSYYVSASLKKQKNISDIANQAEKLLFGSRKPGAKHQSINILTCIDKAIQQFPNLRKNYDDISEIVHPNSASHFYIGKIDDIKKGNLKSTIPFYDFREQDKEKIINMTGESSEYVLFLMKDLIKYLNLKYGQKNNQGKVKLV